jgi:uncharacterized membrane-anchored protein YitT (DUF2179 family)
VHCFTAPAGIAPGGVTGVSTVINHLTGAPIGLISTLINIPLLVIGFVFLPVKLMVKTVISVGVFNITMDYLFVNIPVYSGETILASLFGGVLTGAALGMVYMREATTGGVDIINKLIHKKFPYIKMGIITFILDLAVSAAAVIVYGNFEAGLFAAITIYASSKVIDMFIYGLSESKMLLIVSDKWDEISAEIINMGRGVTLLNGAGAYSGGEKRIICCAAAKSEYFKIKNIASGLDKKSFIIVTTAGEVFGEGF